MFAFRKLVNYRDPDSFASRLRAKRIASLLRIIEDIYAKKGRVDILDVGGAKIYWNILPQGLMEKRNITITLVNLPRDVDIPEEERFFYVDGDGCDLSIYSNNSFDLVHSNSVIEHVGDWERMKMFSNEIKRIGKSYFVQVPYFWFPIEPHCMTLFFHWLPKPLRVSLVMRFSLGHWKKQKNVDDAIKTVESARLLDVKMFSSLFSEAEIEVENFMGLPKSLVAVYDISKKNEEYI